MHVGALVFEGLHLELRGFEFVSQLVDLILVRADGVVEGFCERVRGGFEAGGDVAVRRGRWVVGCGMSSGRGIVGWLAGGRRAVGLQFVLRIEAGRVLGVFVGLGWRVVNVVGEGSGGHGEIWVCFGRTVS